MNRFLSISVALAATALVGATVAATYEPTAQGPGQHGAGGGHMGGGHMGGEHSAAHAAMLTSRDEGSAADLDGVHQLLANHDKIRRTVTRLPDGIRTVTESDDPAVAAQIKAHVASMSQRLKDGREFNIFSKTLPVLFQKRDQIASNVEMTEKGAVVTRTSRSPDVVAALQAHAGEVTELVNEGMVAMRRGMMSRMAMGQSDGAPHTGGMEMAMGMAMGMGMGMGMGRGMGMGGMHGHR
ncbi:hypothetical protein JI739_09930 [Ramlibacter sp. AW1]|uniref:Periplasmic heavy metal sensor n=1 Tax=Ramlibacter aurantiacus TaxID=2801330 RepID=A0A936ZIW3_9BURK|nr:hypothetical protein [Ramlibacter aurantiacus]MBL0420662.1 hypothetical protein [Ramlibacter aurantiacus]